MNDHELIELYQNRSESAITQTASRYGSYCSAIAMNILKNREDTEECINDTYLKVWNSIPPERPESFVSYIGRIVRNLSINRYRAQNAKKRGGIAVLLGELEDCLPSDVNVENEADARCLGERINAFLETIGENEMLYFVRRYWYADSITEIKKRYNVSESKVKTSLFRTRNKLKEELMKEGIEL
jgi:RNA polymerase sigma-70 factor (ECF subfamily)